VKLIKYTALLALLFLQINTYCQEKKGMQLVFHHDGTFKIVQFTDIHYCSGDKSNDLTLANMARIMDNETPDLVVLTGDIVTDGDPEKGWAEVSDPIVKKGIPWAVALGNHDSEGNFSRKKVISIIRKLPLNIQALKTIDISGEGNLDISVKSPEGKNECVLYFFDSHAYTSPFLPGRYDWIKADQIDWYTKTSKSYTAENDAMPVPSLAFFHIPLVEYKYVAGQKDIVGHTGEDVSSSELNTGFFASMVENRDIMGIFTGHDHNNDFIGTYHDIALAYGRCTGEYAYGDLRLGGRVIKLYQGEFRFDTWISTPAGKNYKYSYPKVPGIENDSLKMLAAIKSNAKLKQGVRYTYFKGEIESVSQIENLKPVKTGVRKNFDLEPAIVNDHFAFVFDACIKIPASGLYRFYLSSDDGTALYIDDSLIINNDGSHSTHLEEGGAALEKGYHKIKVLYFDDTMGNNLNVGISGAKIRKMNIPDQMLFIKE
jgi:hypothetical protein